MKNQEKVIIGVVLAIILALALYASFKEDTDKMISVPIENKSSINTEFKSNFISGCMEEDGTYGLCNCAYNSLERQLGTDGMLDLSIEYLKTEQIPEEIVTEMLKDCASEIY